MRLLEATVQGSNLPVFFLWLHCLLLLFVWGWKDDGGGAGDDCLTLRFATQATAAGASMIYQLTGNEKNSLQLKI